MQLLDEFREIGFELAQIVKHELDNLKDNTLRSINNLEKETKQKIHHDLELLEQNMIHQAEYRLNKVLSDRINQINKNILERKNQIIEDLILKSQKKFQEKISQNPTGYMDFLLISLENHAKLLDTECWLQLTSKDREIFKKMNILEKFPQFALHSDIIDDISGYRLMAKNGMFEMDYTFHTLIEKSRPEIAQSIMNRFPIFEVKLEDAVEIFDQIKESSSEGDK